MNYRDGGDSLLEGALTRAEIVSELRNESDAAVVLAVTADGTPPGLTFDRAELKKPSHVSAHAGASQYYWGFAIGGKILVESGQSRREVFSSRIVGRQNGMARRVHGRWSTLQT